MDPRENIISSSSSVVVCIFIAAGTCLPSCGLAVDVISDSTIPAFRRHVAYEIHGDDACTYPSTLMLSTIVYLLKNFEKLIIVSLP
jgi:hypothetical protein